MMELQIPSFLILVATFIFTFIALKDSKTKKSSLSLPPGPWKLPLIGNMQHFIRSVPHHSLRDLAKKYGPLMHLQLGEISAIVVSSPEAAKEVMITHGIIFAQRPLLLAADIVAYGSTDIIFSPHGNYWQQLRKMCITQLLSPKSVQSFRSIRAEEVSNLVRLISSSAGSTINLSREIFSLTFGITTRAAFGEKLGLKDQEEFISVVKEGIQLAGGFTVADLFPSFKFLDSFTGIKTKLEELHRKIDRILESMINAHKSSQLTMKSSEGEHEGLLDVLLNLQKHGGLEFPLSDENVKAVILDVFTAGTETSSTAVEWAMSEMLKNASVLGKAQAEVRNAFRMKGTVDEEGLHELKYLKLVIKETLRLHPPLPLLLPRESRQRCEIFGYEIPVKTKVMINAWAIGRDSKYWSEAERFYPERFLDSSIDYKGANLEFVPFGAGRRICPGIAFSIANVELPIAQLLYHFDWELPNGAKLEQLDMTEAFGLTVRRENDLHLIPNPHRSG